MSMDILSSLMNSRQAFKEAGSNRLLSPVSDTQREKLQKTVLEMYKDIIVFCETNKIVPFLVGGSALGAYRHHGFIPWDDDLDIGMLRSQYDKFVEEFEEEYGYKYVVNSAGRGKNAKTRFTKVIKKGTICKELFSPPDDSINGISVDVFPIDNVPDSNLRRFIKGHHCNLIEFIASQVYYKEFGNEEEIELLKKTGMASFFIRRMFGIIFSFRNAAGWNNRLDKVERWENEKSSKCSIVPGRGHYFGEIIDRSIINPPRYIEFEDIKAPVFNDVEAYLSNLYGKNYMSIPPVEKREKHMIKTLKFGDE